VARVFSEVRLGGGGAPHVLATAATALGAQAVALVAAVALAAVVAIVAVAGANRTLVRVAEAAASLGPAGAQIARGRRGQKVGGRAPMGRGFRPPGVSGRFRLTTAPGGSYEASCALEFSSSKKVELWVEGGHLKVYLVSKRSSKARELLRRCFTRTQEGGGANPRGGAPGRAAAPSGSGPSLPPEPWTQPGHSLGTAWAQLRLPAGSDPSAATARLAARGRELRVSLPAAAPSPPLRIPVE